MYYTDIKLLVLELRISKLIEHMNRLIIKHDNQVINQIVSEHILKLNEYDNNINKVIKSYKKFTKNINNIDNSCDELSIIINIYEVLTEIGNESHQLSLKLAEELNNNNNIDYSYKNKIRGLIQCLERIHIRTRYSRIVEMMK